MPRGRHAYDPSAIQAAKNISLPPKIKCDRCRKFMSHSNFSDKQLTDARMAIMSRGQNAVYTVHCRGCSGGGRLTELKCSWCDKTKGLASFAKSQRTKPDNARCFDCTEDQLAREAVDETAYEEGHKAFEPEDASGGRYPDYWLERSHASRSAASDFGSADADGGVSISDFSSMSISSPVAGTLIESEDTYSTDSFSSTGRSAGPVAPTTSGSSKIQPSHGRFDPTAYGKPASSSMSGVSKAFASTATERSDMSGNKKLFPKIPAHKPQSQIQEDEEDPWGSSESEESEDEDDDDEDTVI